MSERLAVRITAWSGSMAFLLGNAIFFAAWIAWNTLLPGRWHLDPFPFNFLTMTVSLEAIFLAILVLIAENHQAQQDRKMIEHDAETNRKAEREIRQLAEDMQFVKRLLGKMVSES